MLLFAVDRRVMILLDVIITARGDQVGQKIGNPTPFRTGGAAADAGQQGAAPSAQAPAPTSSTGVC